jgi:subtilisin family serine protease
LPKVAYVEADGQIKTTGWKRDTVTVTETNSTWGLGRISHRQTGNKDYLYDASGGEGTCAYIIDTGLNVKHPEFEGRATFVHNFDKVDKTNLDMFGHGTHVAGTIGSKTYGVAKKAKLFGIKACNQLGMCFVSDVIAGIDLTVQDSAKRDCPNGVVINMSLGDVNEHWQSVNAAVKAATQAGVFVSVSAGNSFDDSAKYSPASAPEACTVGAVDSSDVIAVFSNYGKPVKVFAPGVDVMSTYSFNGTIETVSKLERSLPPRTNSFVDEDVWYIYG